MKPAPHTCTEDPMRTATKVPGIKAKHAIVTLNCRTVDRGGSDPSMDAFDEAVRRLREEYFAIDELRDDAWTGHLVLTIEPPEEG